MISTAPKNAFERVDSILLAMGDAKSNRGSSGFSLMGRSNGYKQMRGLGEMGSAASALPQTQSIPPPHNAMPLAPTLPLLDLRHTWLSNEYYENALAHFNSYDPTLWLPTISYNIGGFMFLPWFFLTLECFLGTLFISYYPEHKGWVDMPLDAHVVMAGALSFLVVMRTDASMNRWWEARCAWQTIVNCCYNIGAQIAPVLRSEAATERVLMQIMAFLMVSKASLRDTVMVREEVGGRMDWTFCARLNLSHNPSITALKAIGDTVRLNLPFETEDHKGIGMAIYDEVSEQIRVINHAVGDCKKIKQTPMVYGYIATLRSFLIIWLASLPFSLIGEFGWLAVPALSLLSFLFLNVEQMAVEIEQPFGDDANDLPIEKYIMELELTLKEMIPGYNLDDESPQRHPTRGHGPPPSASLVPGGGGDAAMEERMAALEAAYQRDVLAQQRQLHQLTAELSQARAANGGVRPAVSAVVGGTVPEEEWNRTSPAWRERTRNR